MLTFPGDHESIQILIALISDINGKWHLLAILVIGDIIKVELGSDLSFHTPNCPYSTSLSAAYLLNAPLYSMNLS